MPRNRTVFGLCAAAVLLATMLSGPSRGVFADGNTAAERPIEARSVSPAEHRIEVALAEETETGFVETPLKDAIEFSADLHSITIFIVEDELDDAGIALDSPITLDIAGITLRSALNIMLKRLDLTYVIEDEVMKITTVEAAEKKLVTRVYDVRKLAEAGFEQDALAKTITAAVRAKSWDEERNISELPGCLIVTQSQPAHREIVELLHQLSRTFGELD